MFKVGDMVMYGANGVCEVTDISTQKFAGMDSARQYYTLAPLFEKCVIHAPVDRVKVAMRPVISKQHAQELIEMIPSLEVRPYHGKGVSEVSEHYKAAIKTFALKDLLEVTLSIYAKKAELEGEKRKFGAVDEQFMRQAQDLLFGELSVALAMPIEEVPGYVEGKFEQVLGAKEQLP